MLETELSLWLVLGRMLRQSSVGNYGVKNAEVCTHFKVGVTAIKPMRLYNMPNMVLLEPTLTFRSPINKNVAFNNPLLNL